MHVEQRIGDRDGDAIVAAIDAALTDVYAYLSRRCGDRALAEDLTSDVVLAAVAHVTAGRTDAIDVAYLIGIARHKLVDHWRRQSRERRHLTEVSGRRDDAPDEIDRLEPGRATDVLRTLNPMQQAALTLRYVDDLPVPEVARVLGRSVHATETLLVRAKRAFRTRYAETDRGTAP